MIFDIVTISNPFGRKFKICINQVEAKMLNYAFTCITKRITCQVITVEIQTGRVQTDDEYKLLILLI